MHLFDDGSSYGCTRRTKAAPEIHKAERASDAIPTLFDINGVMEND